MRVLVLADRVVKRLESPRARQHFGDFDLILGAGDLPYHYLSFLADIFGTRCFFVAGNHDEPLTYDQAGFPKTGPSGWTYLGERVIEMDGLLLAGLSGSIAYNPGKPFHYSQSDMWLNALGMAPRLWLAERRRRRPLDFFVTHAPAAGHGDGPDYAHQGFRAFRWLLDRFHPRYHIHGHVHLYGRNSTAWTSYGKTHVINAYGHQIIELETPT